MKNIFLLSGLLLLAFSASSQEHFKINGKLTGVDQKAKVFLTYQTDGASKTDSALLTTGEFSFTGTVSIPTRATLEVKIPGPLNVKLGPKKPVFYDFQVFFLERGNITVKGSNMKTALITGGKTQQEFTNLNVTLNPLHARSAVYSGKLGELWRSSDTTGRAALFAASSAISLNVSNKEEEFIRTNPNSYLSLSLLQLKMNYMEPAKFKSFYNGLSAQIKETDVGKGMASRMEIALKTGIGSPAIDFTQNTSDQKPFTLSSLKGKYVLIDFWASWCGPCRGENPHLVTAYHDFKDKNFEIVSISLDEKKDRWLAAIQQDNMSWIQVSDLKGWYNEVAVAYGIRAIPRNFLIDPNGIIIAKNLRGEEVEKKLKEILEK
ncbi:AhpC/TSA family protein [Pedobacter sp. MC2016-14]|uniref:TlpA disulfide reductase family protein n=1 Tax=Pedobacter sp. MC2016-14 TaxID=2897327 RepID=UPI001E4EC08C|nr:TlpA disulfide reductase family protein [Pedobacter sp. MC2016-14]MCD0488615.1 AhpC/TSA family protein [Pedobacter sp. MC2016-14]